MKNMVKRLGLRLRRKLGQNFLIDESALDLIVESAHVDKDDLVLEVGTGLGNLTDRLAKTGARVLSCEIDPALAHIASNELMGHANVRIVAHDALDGHGQFSAPLAAAIEELLSGAQQFKAVSNLPYCVATPVIGALVEGDWPVTLLVFTIQKEVAGRLVAEPGTKPYSYLSVAVQLQCEVELLRTLASDAFWPRPEVASAIVRLTPKPAEARVTGDRLKGLKRVAKAIFRLRRKTLLNALDTATAVPGDRGAIVDALERCNIEPSTRGERLTPAQMVELAEALGLTTPPP